MPNNPSKLTEEQRRSILQRTIAVLYECIRDAKESTFGGLPNGHLYMTVMTALPELSFDAYTNIIAFLKREGYITETHNLLQITEKPFPWQSGV